MAEWFEGFEPEVIGHIQNRGYDKMQPGEAMAAMYKSYREAEKKMGIPADQVMRIPTDVEGWKPIHQKLGVPADPTGYDFSTVKKSDGTALDPDFADFMRTTAHKLNIPKDAAANFATDFVAREEAKAATAATEHSTRMAAEQATLQAAWGGEYEKRKADTEAFLLRAGTTPEALGELAKSQGYVKTMEQMYVLSLKTGEAQAHGLGGGNSGARTGAMTREQATATIAELQADRSFGTRWRGGETEAVKQWNDLHRIVAGPAPGR